MAERNLVNLTSMDFAEIKQSLKDYLKGQSQFSDYNFEGSGMNIMLDLLAYNSQNNAYLANMIANEANLDSALLRSNIVSIAKGLGYTPKSQTAARAVISITISDPLNTSLSLLLPRGTKFIAGNGAEQYYFVTLQDYNLDYNTTTGLFQHSEIELFEGSIKPYAWTVTEGARYKLPTTDADTSTVRVVVYENDSYTNPKTFERVEGIRNIDNTSEVFWVEETDNRRFELKFGDGVFGVKPDVNNVIYVEYVKTRGPAANDFSTFRLAGVFEGYENADINVVTISPSAGGDVAENSSSIKINAPRKFAAKGKAITKDDFKSVVEDVYPYAKAVEVWGGEEVTPAKFGNVYIAIIPENVSKLTSSNKTMIERKLKTACAIGIRPNVIDPSFVKINMHLDVDVRRNKLDNLPNFHAQLKNVIEDYFDNNTGVFSSSFYYSGLISTIKSYSRSIVTVNSSYTMSIVGLKTTEDFEFANPIIPGTVKTSKVQALGSSDHLPIMDDSAGKLWLGSLEIGTVDYETGAIYINPSLIAPAFADIVEVYATPENDDIIPGFATALILDKSRLSLKLKAV